MIKRRLLILADRLEKIAAKPPNNREFNLRFWLQRGLDCGSACCAVGEATFIPELRRLGLKAKTNPRNGIISPHYGKDCGWAAVQKFFGLGASQARHLFDMYSYKLEESIKPEVVAARIRETVFNSMVGKS